MRDILFRGKRVSDKEWVKGYLWIGNDHSYITPDNVGISYYEKEQRITAFACEVASETVCQYTGLTDKNGRKIFENDIVNCNEKRGEAFRHCKVVWNDVWARYDVIAMGYSFPICLDECEEDICVNGSDYEIIGNIFDNPEMEGRAE